MSSTPGDYSVFNEFKFERKAVGVKFLLVKPEGIERLDKALFFCWPPDHADPSPDVRQGCLVSGHGRCSL